LVVHAVVELGDSVTERTTLHAERNPTVHAARALVRDFLITLGQIDLVPVAQSHWYGAIVRTLAWNIEEPGDLTHP
jgi:hypothetical protein